MTARGRYSWIDLALVALALALLVPLVARAIGAVLAALEGSMGDRF